MMIRLEGMMHVQTARNKQQRSTVKVCYFSFYQHWKRYCTWRICCMLNDVSTYNWRKHIVILKTKQFSLQSIVNSINIHSWPCTFWKRLTLPRWKKWMRCNCIIYLKKWKILLQIGMEDEVPLPPPPSTRCNIINLVIFGGSTVEDDEYVQLTT